jgi:hypothetical protein
MKPLVSNMVLYMVTDEKKEREETSTRICTVESFADHKMRKSRSGDEWRSHAH